jgi:hypothetical protein
MATGSPAAPLPRAWRLPTDSALMRIDGRLDEAAWQAAPMQDRFVQFQPEAGPKPPEGVVTRWQVVVEPHALVFGIKAIDPRPGDIRAPLVRRDAVRRDQDFVLVVIDPVGQRRSAQFVRINAAGVVADGMFIADTDSEDYAPDFDIEAAAVRLPDGYSVELRLPLLSLRYPYAGGAPWRVMVGRSLPREDNLLLLSVPLNKDALSFIAELQVLEGLGTLVEEVREHALLSVRPELTARASRQTGASEASDRALALGAQIKWRPRADWVIDATINPDFSQVELDVPQLSGNTRFALSQPEKRGFFLESTDVLDLPLASFYSRAVTDPGWGLRATWRGAEADATALSLRDDGGGLILRPGPYATGVAPQDDRSQASLLRARWHADRCTVGGMLSQREYKTSGDNLVWGADLACRQDDTQILRLRALASQTSALFDGAGLPQVGASEHGSQWHASWRRQVPGWTFTAEAGRTSPRFRNDNGFVEQAGLRLWQAEVIRRFGAVDWPLVTAHEFEVFLWQQHKHTLADGAQGVPGGELMTRLIHPGVWWAASRQSEGWLRLQPDAARAHQGGVLRNTLSVAGGYSTNPAPWFPRFNSEFEWGQRLDVEADRVGRGGMLLLEADLRAHLQGGWGLESQQRIQHSVVNAPQGGAALQDSSARWIGIVHFNADSSLRTVWQGTRWRRQADASALLAADAQDTRTVSLVLQHRVSLGRQISAGLSSHRDSASALRSTEVFVKASYSLDR